MKIVQLIGALVTLVFAQSQAQSPAYKIAFSGAGKQIQINSGTSKLKISGYAGKEVIIETEMKNTQKPDEADGLKLVTPGMKMDNTGHGANVEVVGDVLKIKIPKSKYFGTYVIKVPFEVDLKIRESNNPYGSWLIENMQGEVDVKSSYTNVFIKEVSGPVVADGGYGKIDVVYSKLDQKRPNSISGSSNVNVTLPVDSKANLKLDSNYGNVFTDFELESLEAEKTNGKSEEEEDENEDDEDDANQPIQPPIPPKQEKKITNGKQKSEINSAILFSIDESKLIEETIKKVEKDVKKGVYNYSFHSDSDNDNENDCNCDPNVSIAKINGGGVNFKIHSSYGNVYLRKKK